MRSRCVCVCVCVFVCWFQAAPDDPCQAAKEKSSSLPGLSVPVKSIKLVKLFIANCITARRTRAAHTCHDSSVCLSVCLCVTLW